MNRKFAIIITAATVLLGVLLIALYIFRSRPQSSEQVQEQTLVPTGVPSIDRGNSIPSISKEDLDTLTTIQSALPFDSDSLAIDYSAITNKVYVEKKNEEADAEFQKFLEDNNLSEVFKMNPELFVITRSKLAQFISKEEQSIDFSTEVDFETSVINPTPTLTYGQQRNQNQLNTFNQLTQFIFSFDKISLKPTEQKPISIGALTLSPSGATTPSSYTELVYRGDTSNIPCAAGKDYGTADGYAGGVLTKIRICRVQGFVVNSQVSRQVDSMISSARNANISLAGGSFRTMDGQIAIYQSWCKRDGIVGSSPPYPKPPGQSVRCPGGAAPGYSNHQMGLAIDFTCEGKLIPRSYSSASQNKCFQWLLANARKYGFFEYGYGKSRDGRTGYEGWHWSVNGN